MLLKFITYICGCNDFKKEEILSYLQEINKARLGELTLVEASNLLKRKNAVSIDKDLE